MITAVGSLRGHLHTGDAPVYELHRSPAMRRAYSLLPIVLLLSACGTGEAGEPSEQAVLAQDLPTILVYKTPTCGCCNGWIEHLEAAGFTVDARDVRD